jgi:alcohol dehydrogenase class IV
LAQRLDQLEPPARGEWVSFDDDRRALRFFNGPLTDPVGALGEAGWGEFELLTTERAADQASELAGAAAKVHLLPPGPVAPSSAAVLDDVGSDRLVAFGGGRVIDSAKGIQSVRGGEVAAIPTTLAGSTMTGFHRIPEGHQPPAFVRPALVVAYSDEMTSAPERQLRATAMNALAHGAESLYTPMADDDSRAAALHGAKLMSEALDQAPAERNAAALALGALLAGIAVDRAAGIALHHVLGQSTVMVLGIPHADVYAALLPRTMAAMRERAPERIGALASALGTDSAGIEGRIEELAGHRTIGELGADRDRIGEVADVAMQRAELAHQTPGHVTREDLVGILEASW